MIPRRAALFAFATSLAPYAVPAALLPSGAAAQAATRATAHQRIRDIDVGIANWTTYIRQLYDRRDPNAYASDAIYRAQFDAWVQGGSGLGERLPQRPAAGARRLDRLAQQ